MVSWCYEASSCYLPLILTSQLTEARIWPSQCRLKRNGKLQNKRCIPAREEVCGLFSWAIATTAHQLSYRGVRADDECAKVWKQATWVQSLGLLAVWVGLRLASSANNLFSRVRIPGLLNMGQVYANTYACANIHACTVCTYTHVQTHTQSLYNEALFLFMGYHGAGTGFMCKWQDY